MSDFDDAITDMVADLKSEAGRSVTYVRGTSSTAMTMRISRLPSQYTDNGQGGFLETQPVDGIGLTSDFPFDPPLAGDRIVANSETYELQPTAGEKVFRRISPQMTRVHMSRISG